MVAKLQKRAWPTPLPGFDEIRRFWDTWHDMCSSKILPGEYYVGNQHEIISTVLGSCISACIRDPAAGVGGMNHFMLPGGVDGAPAGGGACAKFGVFAMEYLINAILKNGGNKANFEIKIFGGANVLDTNMDVGVNNIKFIRDYMQMEGFNVVSEDLGGVRPRKLNFFPQTGKVMLKHLRPVQERVIAERERSYISEAQTEAAGDIEMF